MILGGICSQLRFNTLHDGSNQANKRNTLPSRNTSDEKNLHLGGRKFIYFHQFC